MSEVPVAAAVEAVKANQEQTQTTEPNSASPDPRLASYEKKERQIRQMMKQVQQERDSWEQSKKAKDSEYETNYVPRSRLSEDPLGALAEAGINTEKLTELLMNAPNSNDPTIKAIRAELNAIKDAQKRSEEQQAQNTTAQYEQAKKQISAEVKMLIDGRTEEFEAISQAGLEDAVVQLIEDTFNEKGFLLDVEDAAKQVEEYLVEESFKFAQLKKVQSRLNGPPKTEVDTAELPQQKQTSGQTLTNSMAQAAPQKKLTDKERRERAIAAFHGKLGQ